MIHYKRTTCRACGGDRLRLIISLGPTPLANSFLRSPEEFDTELSFPLDLYFCETCTLIQLLDVIDPEVLFKDYIYVTGTSETIAAHNVQYAQTVVDLLKPEKEDLVVEVASNDGSLLKCFKPYNIRTLGVEPASNIAPMANAQGVETLNVFFNSATAQQIRESHGPAKAVIGNNVLAHVDETVDFLIGFKNLLAKDGLAIIEVPYLNELLDRLEYDTVYHEHLCYFSVSSLMRLCDSAGLSIVRIDHVPVHGGSLRMYAGLPDYYGGPSPSVMAMAEKERQCGLHEFSRYESFAQDVAKNRRLIIRLLENVQRDGKTAAGYGAPAKGNTLLNYCGIDTRLLAFTVDKNPLKVGRYTPGMHLPVLPVSVLLERQPDYVMILPWNIAPEIMHQQAEYHQRGGRFILPVPDPKVV